MSSSDFYSAGLPLNGDELPWGARSCTCSRSLLPQNWNIGGLHATLQCFAELFLLTMCWDRFRPLKNILSRSYQWLRINSEMFLLFVSTSMLPNQAAPRLSPVVLQSWDTISWTILVLRCVFLKIMKILHVDISLASFTSEDFALRASDTFQFWSLTWLWASLFWPVSLAGEVAL